MKKILIIGSLIVLALAGIWWASQGSTINFSSHLQWGAFVGGFPEDIQPFETMVGKKMDIVAVFAGWSDSFPSNEKTVVGDQGKTLLIFWEPSFGYDPIIRGDMDSYIKRFVADAKLYGDPIILVPFDEMNLNESGWGYGQNNNSATKFKTAWQHIHSMFADAPNVKFALDYNNVSVPNISGNQFGDYFPASSTVDYVGVDGFDFGNPHQSFAQIFDQSIAALQIYDKPIYIFSLGAIDGSDKASWIQDGLGTHIKTYPHLQGWVWFNQNDATVPDSGDTINWQVNSDPQSLKAFQTVLAQ